MSVEPYRIPEMKTKEDRETEEREAELRKKQEELRETEKKMLNRVFIRKAGLADMQAEKKKHATLTAEIRKLKKKLNERDLK